MCGIQMKYSVALALPTCTTYTCACETALANSRQMSSAPPHGTVPELPAPLECGYATLTLWQYNPHPSTTESAPFGNPLQSHSSPRL